MCKRHDAVKPFSVLTRLLAAIVPFVGALLVASPTFAGEITLTCTDPTQNEDGSELTDLAGVRIYESYVSGGPYNEVQDVANCAAIPILNRADGTYYFVATAYNIAGVESAYSNETSKTVTTAPQPPSNLVANGNLVAYAIQMSPNVINTYAVGTVPAGTPCDPNMSANGFHRVPVSAVDFIGDANAKVVVAECGSG